MSPMLGHPQLRLGPAVGERGEKPTLVGEMVGEDLRDSIQGRSGESCDMEQSHPLPGGPWEVQEGVASRQSLGSAMGNPPALCAFPLGKGRGERGQSRRCLSPFPLVTHMSAVPRAAGPSAVGPRAVGLLLLHLSRLQHALLRCRREVGESCKMGAIPCPAESSAPLGPPCVPPCEKHPYEKGPGQSHPCSSAVLVHMEELAPEPKGEMLLHSHPGDAPSLSPCPCPAGAAVEHAVLHPHPEAGGAPEQRGVVRLLAGLSAPRHRLVRCLCHHVGPLHWGAAEDASVWSQGAGEGPWKGDRAMLWGFAGAERGLPF